MGRNIVFIGFLSFFSVIFPHVKEKPIVAITASYNNEKWCENNLNSILYQNYENFRVIYIEDHSTDQTLQKVKELIEHHPRGNKVQLVANDVRKGALENQYDAIHQCDDQTIICIVDGDDWLAHSDVFKRINEIYQDETIWLTYGQFKEYPTGEPGFCVQIPEEFVKGNRFRDFTHIPSHLRTFYAGLFKKIKKEHLMLNGSFFEMNADIAAMFPMIEMARKGHFKFIDEVLLIYNGENELNDHKVSKTLQRELDLYIRRRLTRYPALSELFTDLKKTSG